MIVKAKPLQKETVGQQSSKQKKAERLHDIQELLSSCVQPKL